jgi:hypothetical protein
MSKADTIAHKMRNYQYDTAGLAHALWNDAPKTGHYAQQAVVDSTFQRIKDVGAENLEADIGLILQYRHNAEDIATFAHELLAKYDMHKHVLNPFAGSARALNPAPAPPAPVIRGEGGVGVDDDDKVVLVQPVPVIKPPQPGEELNDSDIEFVGTMDETSAGILNEQDLARLRAIVPSDAENAAYAMRREAEKRKKAEEKVEHSREAVARALHLVRVKETELQRARDALLHATRTFEKDERAWDELERAAKRPRGGA